MRALVLAPAGVDRSFKGNVVCDGLFAVSAGFTAYNTWGQSVVDGPGLQRELGVCSLDGDYVVTRMKPATKRFFWGRGADPYVNYTPRFEDTTVPGNRNRETTKRLAPVRDQHVRSRTVFTFTQGTQAHFVTATAGTTDLLVLVFDPAWSGPGRYWVHTDVPVWTWKDNPFVDDDEEATEEDEDSSDPSAGGDDGEYPGEDPEWIATWTADPANAVIPPEFAGMVNPQTGWPPWAVLDPATGFPVEFGPAYHPSVSDYIEEMLDLPDPADDDWMAVWKADPANYEIPPELHGLTMKHGWPAWAEIDPSTGFPTDYSNDYHPPIAEYIQDFMDEMLAYIDMYWDPEEGWRDPREERGEPFSAENVALQFVVDAEGKVQFIESQTLGTTIQYGYFTPPELPTMFGTDDPVVSVEAHVETANWSWGAVTAAYVAGDDVEQGNITADEESAQYPNYDRRWTWFDANMATLTLNYGDPGDTAGSPGPLKAGWVSHARVFWRGPEGNAIPPLAGRFLNHHWWTIEDPYDEFAGEYIMMVPDRILDEMVIVEPGLVVQVIATDSAATAYWVLDSVSLGVYLPKQMVGDQVAQVNKFKTVPNHDVSFGNMLFVKFEQTQWRIWVRRATDRLTSWDSSDDTWRQVTVPYPVSPESILRLGPIHKRKSSDETANAIVGPVAVVDGRPVLLVLTIRVSNLAEIPIPVEGGTVTLAQAYGDPDLNAQAQYAAQRSLYAAFIQKYRDFNSVTRGPAAKTAFFETLTLPLDLPPLFHPLKPALDRAKIRYDLYVPFKSFEELTSKPMTLSAAVSFMAKNPVHGRRVKHTAFVSGPLTSSFFPEDKFVDMILSQDVESAEDEPLLLVDGLEPDVVLTVPGCSEVGSPRVHCSVALGLPGVNGIAVNTPSVQFTEVVSLRGLKGAVGTPNVAVEGPVTLTPRGIMRPTFVAPPRLPMLLFTSIDPSPLGYVTATQSYVGWHEVLSVGVAPSTELGTPRIAGILHAALQLPSLPESSDAGRILIKHGGLTVMWDGQQWVQNVSVFDGAQWEPAAVWTGTGWARF